MAEPKYQDLLIVGNDIALDGIGAPLGISDRASIAQDIKHMIRESGLLVELIGERADEKIKLNLVKLESLVETDLRIVPGTAQLTRLDLETVQVQATTQDFGNLEFNL